MGDAWPKGPSLWSSGAVGPLHSSPSDRRPRPHPGHRVKGGGVTATPACEWGRKDSSEGRRRPWRCLGSATPFHHAASRRPAAVALPSRSARLGARLTGPDRPWGAAGPSRSRVWPARVEVGPSIRGDFVEETAELWLKLLGG